MRMRRRRGGTRRPAKMFIEVVMVGDRRRTFRAIRKTLGGNCYRRDLVEVSEALGVCMYGFSCTVF